MLHVTRLKTQRGDQERKSLPHVSKSRTLLNVECRRGAPPQSSFPLPILFLFLLSVIPCWRVLEILRRRLRGRCAIRAVHPRRELVGNRDVRIRVGGHQLGLGGLQRGAQGRVLDPELIDDRPTLFPPTVRLVCRRERRVEQLLTRLQRLDMPA